MSDTNDAASRVFADEPDESTASAAPADGPTERMASIFDEPIITDDGEVVTEPPPEPEPTPEADLSDAAVANAVEALIDSVETDGEVRRSKTRPKARSRRASDETLESLVNTVNVLAGSVDTLSNTVNNLGEKVTAPKVVAAGDPALVDDPEDGPTGSPLLRVGIDYLCVIATFIGVGLVGWAAMSSSIKGGQLAILVIGALLFIVANGVSDKADKGHDLSDVAVRGVASLLVVLGLGFMVGGITHFSAEPSRAAILVPVGVALAAVGVVMRSTHTVSREHAIWLVGAGVWVCLGLFVALNALGPSDPETPATEPAAAEGADAAAAEHGTEDEAASEAGSEHGTDVTEAATAEHGTTEDHAATEGAATGDHATTEDHGTESAAVTPTTAAAAAGTVTAEDQALIDEATHAAEEASSGH